MRWISWLICGASFAGLGVMIEAFGAHALRPKLTAVDFDIFATAARFQMYHALAIILVAVLAAHTGSRLLSMAGWAFVVGIGLFSGSLYLLVLTGTRILGAVTPFGGVSFMVGWALLIIYGYQTRIGKKDGSG